MQMLHDAHTIFIATWSAIIFLLLIRHWSALSRVIRAYTIIATDTQKAISQAVGYRLSGAPLSQDTLPYVAPVVEALVALRDLQNPDWASALEKIRAQEIARLDSYRPVANRFLLLGLLGTVIGLILSLVTLAGPLSEAFREGKTDLAGSAVNNTLAGVSVAFVCTLTGILGALITNFRFMKTYDTVQQLLTKVDQIILTTVIPALMPKSAVEELRLLNQTLDNRLNQLNTLIVDSQKFIDGLSQAMKQASDEFREVLATAGKTMGSALEQLKSASATIGEVLKSVALDVNRTAAELRSSSDMLKESVGQLDDFYKKLYNLQVNLIHEVETSRSQLHQQMDQSRRDLMEIMNQSRLELQEQINQSRRELNEQINQQLEKIGRLDDTIRERMNEVAARMGDLSRDLQESVAAYREAGDTYERQLHLTLSSRFEALEDSIRKLFRDHDLSLQGVSQEVHAVQHSLEQIRQPWESALRQMRDSITLLEQAVIQAGPQLKQIGADIHEVNRRLLSEAERAYGEVRRIFDEVDQRAQLFLQRRENDHTVLREQMQQIEAHLHTIASDGKLLKAFKELSDKIETLVRDREVSKRARKSTRSLSGETTEARPLDANEDIVNLPQLAQREDSSQNL